MSEYADPAVQDYYGTKRVTAWPATDFDGKPGYAVQYEGGYTSWSPADVFAAAYQPITAMSFGHALVAFKAGHKVGRGSPQPLVILDPTDPSRFGFYNLHPNDLLADDWTIVT